MAQNRGTDWLIAQQAKSREKWTERRERTGNRGGRGQRSHLYNADLTEQDSQNSWLLSHQLPNKQVYNFEIITSSATNHQSSVEVDV